jgi:hypothetical protein
VFSIYLHSITAESRIRKCRLLIFCRARASLGTGLDYS